ncbi:MAG: hypothetical protein ACYSYV_02105 [Planctomycetota bacterium]|jgi:hypothetical protein
MKNGTNTQALTAPSILPDGNGGYTPCPDLMTEVELIRFLRIPEISKAKDHHSVIENLKRMHGLPSIHISRQPLYPRDAICKWIEDKLNGEMN